MGVNTFERGYTLHPQGGLTLNKGEAVVHHRVPKRRRDARARLHQAIFF
jgi:hypothetical protein